MRFITIYKITKIVRAIWLVKNLWFIIPINPAQRKRQPGHEPYAKLAFDLQTTILERLKNRTVHLSSP